MGTAKMKTATETLDDLKARILSGDETVTAEELGHATQAADHEKLREQAAEILAAEQAATDQLARIRGIGANLIAAYEDDQEQADFNALRDAVANIVRRSERRKDAFNKAYGALAREGVPIGGEPTAGISRREAGMGLGDRIIVNDQVITYSAPGATCADAIASALGDTGKSNGFLAPNITLVAKRRPRQESPEQAQRREQMRLDMLTRMREQESVSR
ncbi:hypothetical protein [Streptosporangium minutum]|uniref:Uncharacterized protein n=1 Tax=Streptosporangium minutum TaxID=569862 RepID=A0A243RM85_9ACTN|nr:hypothetical protein [Streptosporangium minutum]OUC96068.1 hypothetical protein CA984_16445 [Streptosporangium minutum]